MWVSFLGILGNINNILNKKMKKDYDLASEW